MQVAGINLKSGFQSVTYRAYYSYNQPYTGFTSSISYFKT
jgi:hypothetical protein